MKTKIHFSKLYQLLEGRFRDVPHGFAVRTLIFCARRLYGFSAGFAKTHIENGGIFVLPEALGGPGGGREVAGRAGRAPGGPPGASQEAQEAGNDEFLLKFLMKINIFEAPRFPGGPGSRK